MYPHNPTNKPGQILIHKEELFIIKVIQSTDMHYIVETIYDNDKKLNHRRQFEMAWHWAHENYNPINELGKILYGSDDDSNNI